MKDIILRINRAGEFDVEDTQQTASQCGKPGIRHYNYFVTIAATNNQLTPDGFVMENGIVDEYFQATYNHKQMACESCELMACKAIEHFRNLFNTVDELKVVELTRIFVRIHGSDVSFIEGEWINK